MENSKRSFSLQDSILLGSIDTEPKENHICVFVPSKTRDEKLLDHEYWVDAAIQAMSELFGGATAVEAIGGWLDDERGNKIKKEKVTLVVSFIGAEEWNVKKQSLRRFLHRMGREAQQGEIGVLTNGCFTRIRRFDNE